MDFISCLWNVGHQLENQIEVLGDAWLSAVNCIVRWTAVNYINICKQLSDNCTLKSLALSKEKFKLMSFMWKGTAKRMIVLQDDGSVFIFSPFYWWVEFLEGLNFLGILGELFCSCILYCFLFKITAVVTLTYLSFCSFWEIVLVLSLQLLTPLLLYVKKEKNWFSFFYWPSTSFVIRYGILWKLN